jgi:hypothetical protein
LGFKYFVAKVGSHVCKMAVCENEKGYYRPGIIPDKDLEKFD